MDQSYNLYLKSQLSSEYGFTCDVLEIGRHLLEYSPLPASDLCVATWS